MARGRKQKLRHPWLPADDPANSEIRRSYRRWSEPGYWVPTPDEIDFACSKFRKLKEAIGSADRSIEKPEFYSVATVRRFIEDAEQLCDCPYWGTEFSE